MTSAVETAIRKTINKGMMRIATFNRARSTASVPHPYLTGLHAPMTEELTLRDLSVTGTIPKGLDGIYLRNGPNPVTPPNPARYHWFTGDGMVHGLRIQDGRAAWYRNRWVRSSAVSRALNEAPAPGDRHAEMSVNTNVIGHAGKVWALVEAGATPVRLDEALGTVAHDAFGGTLKGAFSAHPHRDPDTGDLHAICYFAPDLEHVHHVVVGANGLVRRQTPIAVHHGPSIHDCAITARFVIVLDLPVTFSFSAMLAGYEFPYRWNNAHPARIGLLPRGDTTEDGSGIVWCGVDPCYVYHPCNAYDRADGCVVLDVIAHDRNGYRDFRGPDAEHVSLERWIIDPQTRTTTRTVLDDTPQEFPRIDERLTGKPYRFAYAVQVAAGADDTVGDTIIFKHDLQTGTRQLHDFGHSEAGRNHPGEFVFIPAHANAAEDEGWLMGLVVNAQSTDLVILDAQTFTGLPVARIHLPHRVPPGFHGNWVSTTLTAGEHV